MAISKERAMDFLKEYHLQIYDFGAWFKSACSALNQALMSNKEQRELLNENKENLRTDIHNFLSELPTNTTKSSLLSKIVELKKGTNYEDLNIGIIQKIISLLFKYVFFFYYAKGELQNEFDKMLEDFAWADNENILKELLPPIDVNILFSIKEIKGKEIKGKEELKNLGIKINTYNSANVNIGNEKALCWSKFDKETYEKIMGIIFGIAKDRNISPMELEDELWRNRK